MDKFDRLKTITILYVEDSKFLAKATLRGIEKYFHKVYLVHNGQEALDVLNVYKNKIDLIITDLVMPVLDGISMIEEIRRDDKDIPIIITTGHDDALGVEKIIELSIDGFLLKPINIAKLLEKVDHVVNALFVKRELETKKVMIDNNIIYSETDENGVITYVSKPFEKISGYSREELTGKTHAIIKSPDAPSLIYQDMWNTLKSHKQWHGELTNRRKNGVSYTVSIVISPMYFREELTGYSATCIDITELRLKSIQLHEKSKLAALGEMISMIAHQWRQPITSIAMISNNLQLDLMFDDLDKNTLKSNLGKMNEHIGHLSKTIDVFKDFLKEEKRKSKFIMSDIIKEAIAKAEDKSQNKELVINIKNDCTSFTMNAFRDGLVQSLANMITNSREAFVIRNTVDASIDIVCSEDSKSIFIKISDNAGGIKEEILPEIFTPYFSTKIDKNSVGLGLYTAKTIVEDALDGLLSVKNKDEGAEFIIKLPK